MATLKLEQWHLQYLIIAYIVFTIIAFLVCMTEVKLFRYRELFLTHYKPKWRSSIFWNVCLLMVLLLTLLNLQQDHINVGATFGN